MRLVGALTVAITVMLPVPFVEAHEQQAVVGGQRVQPTPKMIDELKKKHAKEQQARPHQETESPRPPQLPGGMKKDREKDGEGQDEGIARENE